MIFIFGPDTPLPAEDDEAASGEGVAPRGDPVDAATLGEALDHYAKAYSVTFEPYDGSYPDHPFANAEPDKYFWFDGKVHSSNFETAERRRRPVDIHVFRDGQTICPKQDLSFALQPGDEIEVDVIVMC